MADHVWKLLAQGMVDSLNEQTFSLEAEAERGWKTYKQRADFEEPTITVVPATKASEPIARGGIRNNSISMSVMVQRVTGAVSGEDDAVDREDVIAGLAQEVEDYLASPDNRIEIVEGTAESPVVRYAVPTGQSTAEVVEDWLSDGVFAVLMTVDYTLIR